MMIKAMPYRSFLKRAFFVKGMHENKGDHANIGTKKQCESTSMPMWSKVISSGEVFYSTLLTFFPLWAFELNIISN